MINLTLTKRSYGIYLAEIECPNHDIAKAVLKAFDESILGSLMHEGYVKLSYLTERKIPFVNEFLVLSKKLDQRAGVEEKH